MLAHSTPRNFFATESDLRKALIMDIDLSPSQLVTHPAQSHPSDLQSVINTHNQTTPASVQPSPLPQKLLLRTLAPLDTGSSPFSMQGAMQPSPQLGNVTTIPGSYLDNVINPHDVQFPVSTGEVTGTTVSINTEGNPSSSRSSSASSEHRTQMASYSRRNDGGGSGKGSPKSAPADITSFGRFSHAARQRTAQACEKCRERKTKCSGTKPTCKRCADRGLQCVWAPDTRVRGPARQPRSSRIESGDNTGEPLSVLPVPLTDSSGESSPSFHGRDYPSSAPAFQTTFPAISLPSHLIMRDQQKRQSWHEGAFFPGGVARGWNAHNIMGEPIRPLTAVDDCWSSVENAKTEPFGRDRAATIRPRERRTSVSVAHLALARNRDDQQFVPTNQVPQYFDLSANYSSVPHYAGEGNTDLSVPIGGVHSSFSSGTSESEPSLSATPSHNSSSADSQLHQPLPSYDVASKLSDEMAKLLNIPRAYDTQANESGVLQAFPGIEHTFPENANDAADEIFAQYFDADAFGMQQ